MAKKEIVVEVKRGRGRPRKPVPYVERRGGKREGAGRKPYLAEEEKKRNVVLSVSPLCKEHCTTLREKGINLSKEFEKVVERLAKVLCE